MDKNAKPANTPKVKHIPVNLPDTGFAVILYFNRFGLERLEGQFVIHFGLVNKAGEVLAAYSTVMDGDLVKNSRDEWLSYLGKIGEPPDSAIDLTWRPPISRLESVAFANACRLARSGNEAEIRLYTISLVTVVEAQKQSTIDPKGIPGQPLALLKTSLEQQQLLLLALLKED